MTRAELIEAMAQAAYEDRNGMDAVPWYQKDGMRKRPYLDAASSGLLAIELAGLAIVPEKATAEQFSAGMSSVNAMDRRAVKTVDWEAVYAAMIAAGRV